MTKPEWNFADAEVLGWAAMADQDAKQFARLALTWPQDRCDALGGFVQKMFGRRMRDRGSLQNLARTLTGVKQYRSVRDQEEREKAVRLEEVERHRQALAAVAKVHPKGNLIGAAGSRSSGPKGH